MTDAPLYVHDCDNCEYLGRFVGNAPYQSNQHSLDIYWCASEWETDDGRTVRDETPVARWSSEGPDYHSGKVFVGRIPALTEAYRRAFDRSLTHL